jgi:hypothetical protein
MGDFFSNFGSNLSAAGSTLKNSFSKLGTKDDDLLEQLKSILPNQTPVAGSPPQMNAALGQQSVLPPGAMQGFQNNVAAGAFQPGAAPFPQISGGPPVAVPTPATPASGTQDPSQMITQLLQLIKSKGMDFFKGAGSGTS